MIISFSYNLLKFTLLLDSIIFKILLEHESGQYNKIAELIKISNNINAQDENGYTALHIGEYFHLFLKFNHRINFLLLNSC
jgi:hypothetical protein